MIGAKEEGTLSGGWMRATMVFGANTCPLVVARAAYTSKHDFIIYRRWTSGPRDRDELGTAEFMLP